MTDTEQPTDRGIAFDYLVMAGTVIMAAAVYAIFSQPVSDIISNAESQCITAACTEGVSAVDAMWTWAPLWVLGFIVLMVVATSVWESRRIP